MNLVNIGFGNLINADRVILTDSDNVVLSYMDLKQISQRFGGEVISDE